MDRKTKTAATQCQVVNGDGGVLKIAKIFLGCNVGLELTPQKDIPQKARLYCFWKKTA